MQSGPHRFSPDDLRKRYLSQKKKKKLRLASPHADPHDRSLSPTRKGGVQVIIPIAEGV